MEANQFTRSRISYAGVTLILLATVFHTGCVGFMSALGYWTGGAMKDAEFDQLEGKRVAVVCMSDSSSFGPGTDSLTLARGVGDLLQQRLEEVDLVRSDEIADWIDHNDWDEVDYVEIGKGVKADVVIAIELSGFSLYEGQTLYKGRATVQVRVLDMTAGGKEVFRRDLHEVSYPNNGAYPTTETSESRFRRAFIKRLSEEVAKFFYSYDMMEDFGPDSASVG